MCVLTNIPYAGVLRSTVIGRFLRYYYAVRLLPRFRVTDLPSSCAELSGRVPFLYPAEPHPPQNEFDGAYWFRYL